MSVQQDRVNIQQAAVARNVQQVLANLNFYDWRYRHLIRDDFGFFRQHVRPTMLWGWWNEVVATELTEFYQDFVAGKRPKVVICTPPQHGKWWTAVDFIGWVSGRDPNLKTIFASFSDELLSSLVSDGDDHRRRVNRRALPARGAHVAAALSRREIGQPRASVITRRIFSSAISVLGKSTTIRSGRLLS
jgi:hypothetical protein